jgi:hypothetical protein
VLGRFACQFIPGCVQQDGRAERLNEAVQQQLEGLLDRLELLLSRRLERLGGGSRLEAEAADEDQRSAEEQGD